LPLSSYNLDLLSLLLSKYWFNFYY